MSIVLSSVLTYTKFYRKLIIVKRGVYALFFLLPPVCSFERVASNDSNISRFSLSSVPSLIFFLWYFAQLNKERLVTTCLSGRCPRSRIYALRASLFWYLLESFLLAITMDVYSSMSYTASSTCSLSSSIRQFSFFACRLRLDM